MNRSHARIKVLNANLPIKREGGQKYPSVCMCVYIYVWLYVHAYMHRFIQKSTEEVTRGSNKIHYAICEELSSNTGFPELSDSLYLFQLNYTIRE